MLHCTGLQAGMTQGSQSQQPPDNTQQCSFFPCVRVGLIPLAGPSCRENEEALIASSSMDLETGQAGLFRQFFSILPLAASDSPPVLVACRWGMVGDQGEGAAAGRRNCCVQLAWLGVGAGSTKPEALGA